MYLSRVGISGFRGISKIDLPLTKGLNIIVGENNIGKTAIIDAIRIALGSDSTGGDKIWVRREDLHKTGYNTYDSVVRIDLFFSGLSDSEIGLFVEALNYNKDEPKESTISIHFEWSWDNVKERYTINRWGGERETTKAAIDDEALQSLRWTYLGALRDASTALEPGRNSRLAKLISALSSEEERGTLAAIYKSANDNIEKEDLIKRTKGKITSLLAEKLGDKLKQEPLIRAAEFDFDRIVKALKLVIKGKFENPEDAASFDSLALELNGLGYNNLLYIATVLAELEASKSSVYRVLLVEEPEAHLHPQLQVKLCDYLQEKLPTPVQSLTISPNNKTEERKNEQGLQVIVTSHSPVISSRVRVEQLRIVHSDSNGLFKTACPGLGDCILEPPQKAEIQRLLDVTKATMLFSKGVIFVEGISEALLLPLLAKKMKTPLEDHAVSVVPVYGVDFTTLALLFGQGACQFDIPVSIVTDGDPAKVKEDGTAWKKSQDIYDDAFPKKNASGLLTQCERVEALNQFCAKKGNIELCVADVTLEYDLALAGKNNVMLMTEAIRSAYKRVPSEFSEASIENIGDDEKAALFIWRHICLRDTKSSKSIFAHELAYLLETNDTGFSVPHYIIKAINHACGKISDDH